MKILHLSDIHFGRNYARTKITDPFEKRDEIMDGLISCIGGIPEGQKPEHIVVTGDIAWFGKRDEYDEAKTWFLRLLEVTGLKGKDLTFCVGNHDVNWSYGQIIDELTDETITAIDEAYEYRNISPSPPKIWRFSSAHFYRKVISETNNLWYNILEVKGRISEP